MARGGPQIEVTYDIDANGILNVSAIEKSTGKENKITITNDTGRLSKEDIEKMVNDAETYKAEDDANRERIEAKNGLENYAYSMQNTVSDEKIKDKISEDEQEAITKACEETLSWLDANAAANKDEYEEKQKSLENICNPIMQKLYAGDGAGGGEGMPQMPTQMPTTEEPSDDAGPSIEEVD